MGDRLKTSPRETDLSKPNIEIDRASILEQDYSQVEPVKINKELYLRLIKVGVLLKEDIEGGQTPEEVKESTETEWPLTKQQTAEYMNGEVLGRYLIFLKKHMKHEWNQIWSLKVQKIREIRQGFDQTSVEFNWSIIYDELDVSARSLNFLNLLTLLRLTNSNISFNRTWP